MLIPAKVPPQHRETALLHATLLLHVFLAVLIQFMGIGSAVIFFVISLGLGFGFAIGIILDYMDKTAGNGKSVSPIVRVEI